MRRRLRRSRYYVGVSEPGVAGTCADEAQLAVLSSGVSTLLSSFGDVVVETAGQRPPRAVRRLIESGDLTGYQIETSLARLEQRPGEYRAVVMVVVASFPERNVRSVLEGSARVAAPRLDRETLGALMEGALASALRDLPRALALSSR